MPGAPGLAMDGSAAPAARPWVGSCNCSLCTRTGWLVAFYPDDGAVTVRGETAQYVWGDKMIAIHFCPKCGCGTHWTSTGESYGKMGVNARMLDGFEVRERVCGGDDGNPVDYAFEDEPLEVRFLDNAG